MYNLIVTLQGKDLSYCFLFKGPESPKVKNMPKATLLETCIYTLGCRMQNLYSFHTTKLPLTYK